MRPMILFVRFCFFTTRFHSGKDRKNRALSQRRVEPFFESFFLSRSLIDKRRVHVHQEMPIAAFVVLVDDRFAVFRTMKRTVYPIASLFKKRFHPPERVFPFGDIRFQLMISYDVRIDKRLTV